MVIKIKLIDTQKGVKVQKRARLNFKRKIIFKSQLSSARFQWQPVLLQDQRGMDAFINKGLLIYLKFLELVMKRKT